MQIMNNQHLQAANNVYIEGIQYNRISCKGHSRIS